MIISDEKERLQALDVKDSFIIQAPAGSGKTELITQRFLALLGQVNLPEEILAITFTKKASAEMRARIIAALQKAQLVIDEKKSLDNESQHERKTRLLATEALHRDKKLQWEILNNPNRLRIQTIDSFNAGLTKTLPILSRFGAPPDISPDPLPLYREAIQELLSHLEDNLAWSESIARLLSHLDNDLEKVQNLLINLLMKRDQWLPILMSTTQDDLRAKLENNLENVVLDILKSIQDHFPENLSQEMLSLLTFISNNVPATSPLKMDLLSFPNYSLTDMSAWRTIAQLLLTNEHEYRKRYDKNLGFPAPSSSKNSQEKMLYAEMKERMTALTNSLVGNAKLQTALSNLLTAPSSKYDDKQWEILSALYETLRIVVGLLKVTFSKHSKIDYIENAQAALFALGTDEGPTDLALTLDYQIKHLLVDEFQDTSFSQYRLIEKLTLGWENQDGRTLFVVGDPMQSIYRFREAEVGLFINARTFGINGIRLTPLTLTVNFRSTATVIEWVNQHFSHVFPQTENVELGAITYSPSIAFNQQTTGTEVKLHPSITAQTCQGDDIVTLIKQTQATHPDYKIAILVRSRTHLNDVIPALQKAALPYRALDIDALSSRAIIQDLLALTRALLHPADRIAWLSILRAPWCGLSLNDLLAITQEDADSCIYALLQDPKRIDKLTALGRKQITRFLSVITPSLNDRRRFPLNSWIEHTWLLLGGPACVDAISDLEDAKAFFKLLEKVAVGGEIINFKELTDQINKLYATTSTDTAATLQIMTIHNAKGLEFDVVILPHLERKSAIEDKQILLWMEKQFSNGNNGLLLAPIHAVGDNSDPIYEYIKKQQLNKLDYEYARLLYVAVTRAKKHLHLFFSLSAKENELATPAARSLLEKLMPTIKHEIKLVIGADEHLTTEVKNFPRLKRLTVDWKNPLTAHQVREAIHYDQTRPVFTLPAKPKIIGILIHKILQQISLQGVSWWTMQTDTLKKDYVKNQLLQLGLIAKDLYDAQKYIATAINNTLADAKGLWILQSQREAQSELALMTIIKNKPAKIIIDRTFIDNEDVRWIIDYKTATFSIGELNQFLSLEQAKHIEQLQKYAYAMQSLDPSREIKLGLYFPYLAAWYEYDFTLRTVTG